MRWDRSRSRAGLDVLRGNTRSLHPDTTSTGAEGQCGDDAGVEAFHTGRPMWNVISDGYSRL